MPSYVKRTLIVDAETGAEIRRYGTDQSLDERELHKITMDEVVDLVVQGMKIVAIKVVRDEWHVDLKTAKEMVEMMVACTGAGRCWHETF